MQRRAFITGLAASSAALSGCLGGVIGSGDGEQPAPVDLSGQKFDDQGGMEIGPHGGPNGQIFYEDHAPEDRTDSPFWFHTLSHGLFPHYFDHTNRGWSTEVVYVTDFSTIDYGVQERNGMPTMPSPTGNDTFADATEVTFVVESDVMGGMGPDLHPFSEMSDAESFTAEHGGETVGFDDVNRQLVETLRRGGPGN